MPRRLEARPFFRPDREELRYLPECPRRIGNALYWVSIQYAADRPAGGLNRLDLATRENVHYALPGRPGFFAETDDPGLLVIGLERRLVHFDLARGEITETLAEHPRRRAGDHQRRHRHPRRPDLRHQAPGVQPAHRRAVSLRQRDARGARTARRAGLLQREVLRWRPADRYRHASPKRSPSTATMARSTPRA